MGYDTDDFRQLKDEIEFLIERGKLSPFTKDGDQNNSRRDYDKREDDRDRNPRPKGSVINMVSGGPIAARTTRNSRKAYTREVMHIVGEALKHAKTEVAISFDDSDLEGVKFLYDDPLVIIHVIGNN